MSKRIEDITVQELAAEAKRLAAENPEFVYVPPPVPEYDEDADDYVEDRYDSNEYSALYVHEEPDGTMKGGCMFGQALCNLGVDPKTLRQYEGRLVAAMPLAGKNGEEIVGLTLLGMEEVQQAQDEGKPWGEAIRRIDVMIPEDDEVVSRA